MSEQVPVMNAADHAPQPPTQWWRSGKGVIVFIVAGLLVGGYFYMGTVPPSWLRAFGAEIALRATADPQATAPEDTREASPRGLADNPLICLANIARQPWDRAVFVTYAQSKALPEHPVLSKADWPDRAAKQGQLAADDRYQLIVLLKDGRVVNAEFFFTFWADLAGASRPEGYGPEDAIFTAESHAGHYVLSVAPNASLDACPKK